LRGREDLQGEDNRFMPRPAVVVKPVCMEPLKGATKKPAAKKTVSMTGHVIA